MDLKKLSEQPFVDVIKREHIYSILEKIFKKKAKLQIWQKGENLRLRTTGKLNNLNLQQSIIELEADSKDGFYDFHDDEIFFYTPMRTTIFKSKIIKKEGDNIIRVAYPDVVKMEEARTAPRKQYGLRSYQSIDIVAVTKDGKKVNFSDLRLLDSSNNGAAFLLTKMSAALVEVGSRFVSLSSSVSGIEKRAGIIRNITKFRNNLTGEQCYRIGVEFISNDC